MVNFFFVSDLLFIDGKMITTEIYLKTESCKHLIKIEKA